MVLLDLFSGIGGFSLAASWVWGKDLEILAFCEKDPFCQKVLKKHWPDVPIISDIRNVTKTEETVDIITGGFPCQPFSAAGQRKGSEDNNYLWPQMLRTILLFRPRWILAENVHGILNIEGGMVFENCCTDLEKEGYEVETLVIPACSKGAPHRRDRVWIIGYSRDSIKGKERRSSPEPKKSKAEREWSIAWNSTELSNKTDRNSISSRFGRKSWRSAALKSEIRHIPSWKDVAINTEQLTSNTSGNRLIWSKEQNMSSPRRQQASRWNNFNRYNLESEFWSEHWIQVALRTCIRGMDDGISRRLDKHRAKRIKALGNSIVPQIVQQIFLAMKWVDENTGL